MLIYHFGSFDGLLVAMNAAPLAKPPMYHVVHAAIRGVLEDGWVGAMATECGRRVVIDAPSDDVWRVLVDVERMPEWTGSMTSARIVEGTATGAGLGLGLAVEIEQPRMPAMVWTVDELTPGRHFRWVSTKPGVTTYGDHWVEPVDDGARAAVRLRIRHTGPLASLVGALTMRRTARYVDMEADGLKAQCEAVAGR